MTDLRSHAGENIRALNFAATATSILTWAVIAGCFLLIVAGVL